MSGDTALLARLTKSLQTSLLGLDAFLNKAVAGQRQTLVEDKLSQWLSNNELKLRAVIDSAIDPTGYASVERSVPQLDNLRRTRPNADTLLPATFPDIEIQEISAQLAGLRNDLDAIPRLEELFLSRTQFQSEIEVRVTAWVLEVQQRLAQQLADPERVAPPQTMLRVSSHLPIDVFKSPAAQDLRGRLQRRVEVLIRIYTVSSPGGAPSALTAIRATLATGHEKVRRYLILLRKVTTEWCTNREEAAARLVATFIPQLRTCTDDLIEAVGTYLETTVVPPLKLLVLPLSIDTTGPVLQIDTSKWKTEIASRLLETVDVKETQLREAARSAVDQFITTVQEQLTLLDEETGRLFARLDQFISGNSGHLQNAAAECLKTERRHAHTAKFTQRYQELSDLLDRDLQTHYQEALQAIQVPEGSDAKRDVARSRAIRAVRVPAIVSLLFLVVAVWFLSFSIAELTTRGVIILSLAGAFAWLVYCASTFRQYRRSLDRTAHREKQHRVDTKIGNINHVIKVFQRDVVAEITTHNNAEQKAILGAFSTAWDSLTEICNELRTTVAAIRSEFGKLYTARMDIIELATTNSLELQKHEFVKFLKNFAISWRQCSEGEIKSRLRQVFLQLRTDFATATQCNAVAAQTLKRLAAELESRGAQKPVAPAPLAPDV